VKADGFAPWGSSTDRRYWLFNSQAVRNPQLLGPNYNDFYFPTAGSTSSSAQYNGNWTRFFGTDVDFRVPGLLLPAAMSVLHQSIVATGNYIDTDVIANYMQSNAFRSFWGNISFGSLGEFVGVDRGITQNDAGSVTRIVYASGYREVPLVFPIPAGCPLPPPTSGAVCNRVTLQWVQNSSISISGPSLSPAAPGTPIAPVTPVIISNPLIVNGNVSINIATIVLGEGNSSQSGRVIEPAVVNATGCIDIQGGQLQLPFTQGTQVGETTPRILIVSLANCLSGKFDSVIPLLVGADPCSNVTAIPTYSSRELSVVFSINNDVCQSPAENVSTLQVWVIPVAVVCAVVGTIGILLALYFIPCIRKRVAPGIEFRRRVKSLKPAPTL
jgi:hypothetical protein